MFFIYLILIVLIHESAQESEVSNHIHNQKREETEDQRELSGKDANNAEIVFNGEDKNAVYWRRRSKILKDVKKTRVESLFDKHVIIQIIQ